MAFIDSLFILGPIRKAMWQAWYPFLTRKLRDENVTFLNYAYEKSPPWGIPLNKEDAPNRACIQLYHHVAEQIDLKDKTVLEVSCGHGGGASYITRTFKPKHYTGLDLNPTGIAFCKTHHSIEGLEFLQGDAQSLPFKDQSIDAVINVEASHCYPSFPKFLTEVERILKAGGSLLYADFRFSDRFKEWESAIQGSRLQVKQERDISPQVLNGMDLNSSRSQELVRRLLPKFMHGLAGDFAGVQGSRIYEALKSGELIYKSYHFTKE